MDYTLAEVKLKVNLLCDKMGSDYFTTPQMLAVFRTAALDFIGEKLRIVEKTFEVMDDIANLVVNTSTIVTLDVNNANEYITGLPLNFLRLLSYSVEYSDNTKCRRAKFAKLGQKEVLKADPNNKPTKNYPLITREDSIFRIECGNVAVPSRFKITYAKMPTIAETNQPDVRIINLPDTAIEEIMYKVVTKLFNITDDSRTQTNYMLQESFRQVFK